MLDVRALKQKIIVFLYFLNIIYGFLDINLTTLSLIFHTENSKLLNHSLRIIDVVHPDDPWCTFP